jgi:quercetin dioxygenase-like cupin family protein
MRRAVTFALFLFACSRSSSQAPPPASGDSTSGFTIDRCISKFLPAKIESTAAGYQYWFVDKGFVDGRTIKLSVVRPHKATHEPHIHPEDEFFFVLQGTAEFFLNGKTRIVGPMTSLYCPPNVKHGIRNGGETELRYLVIKKYPVK